MNLTKKELATVLAALRTFQERPAVGMEHFKNVRPLASKQIDDLCERLNCSTLVERFNRFKRETLKLVIHIEEGIVQGVYANIPKAAVSVYDTDPEAGDLEKEKRNLKRAIKGLTDVRK
ncbi:MAG TPA: hypothetical protein PKV84_01605 [Candidatus Omnitrophota bacterium]|nr:hypothetical protein [Candidatus Omnitrophota bacterium]